MAPFRSGDYLLNFLAGGERGTIRAAFGANYERLVEVKTKYRPDELLPGQSEPEAHRGGRALSRTRELVTTCVSSPRCASRPLRRTRVPARAPGA